VFQNFTIENKIIQLTDYIEVHFQSEDGVCEKSHK